MIEVGPLRVNDDGSLREVSGWNEYSSVLFREFALLRSDRRRLTFLPSPVTVDQPAGTGFSYVNKNDNVRELAEAADQVVNFLANFYKLFPEFIGMDVSWEDLSLSSPSVDPDSSLSRPTSQERATQDSTSPTSPTPSSSRLSSPPRSKA